MAIKTHDEFLGGPGSIPDVVKIEPDEDLVDPTRTSGRAMRTLLRDLVDTVFANLAGAKLVRDITVNVPQGSVGGLSNDEVVPKTIEYTDLVERLLRGAGDVTYEGPIATLSRTPDRLKEIGEVIGLNFGVSFNQRDAGAMTGVKLYQNDVLLGESNPFLLEEFVVSAVPQTFRAVVSYATGPVKVNNLGEAETTGRIPAGSVPSNPVTEVGYHKIWLGPVTSAPLTGADARTLLTGVLTANLSAEGKTTLNTGSEAIRFAILLPPGLGLLSVRDSDSSDANLTPGYVLLNDNFTGQDANGSPVPGCSLFMLTQSVPYSSNHRHVITVA